MRDYSVELALYYNCLFDIKKRIEVITDHLNNITIEKYWIVEVETVCLQFRKILENIALMSLVANKEVYAEQNEKFAKHYHAKRIMNDLERVNPDFYPVPTRRIKHEDKPDEWVKKESGYLTKDELVEIYETCGGMMHTQNPFASPKPIQEIHARFTEWLTKICILLDHHHITLVGGKIMFVALMERKDNGLPQVVIFERME